MEKQIIGLALQGGGSHGAFTWGVLDRLLDDQRIEFGGISGTSAGAINGVLLVDGYCRGGREGSRELLKKFWSKISTVAEFSPLRRTVFDRVFGNWSLDFSPGYATLDILTRIYSPYQFNLLDINPIRDVLAEIVDFDNVRGCRELPLFISATNVRTGTNKTFPRNEVTLDVVMASACLPYLFKAVEIDGEAYWDGGYMGNPSLFPLALECRLRDILIIQINPIRRPEIPITVREIMNRINEITYNAGLFKDIRSLALLKNFYSDTGDRSDIRFHMIDANERELMNLATSSKYNAEQDFIQHLFQLGCDEASKWLNAHFEQIGNSSTINVEGVF